MAITNIDPTGEVIIEVGDQQLRVSSKVLSLASPVFKPMFNSGFKEGLTSEVTADSPRTIPLPDDDFQAFLCLCQIVHMQHNNTKTVDVDIMEKLAWLCDKYQCTNAVGIFTD